MKGEPMEVPTRADIDQLLESRDGPCVSLFMPTHRKGPETQQDRVRLKNLLDEAGERLTQLDLRSPDVRALLQAGRDLLEDGEFWRHQGDGLAVYLAPGWSRRLRVPFGLPELTVVSGRFHVSALFAGLWPDQRFYLLALSQGQNRLFEGWRYGLQSHEIPDAPASIDDWLQFIEPEKQLQAHSGQRRDSGRAAIFHGHGLGRDVEDERIVEYLRLVDSAVTAALRDTKPPLVLAAVEYVRALYRDTTRYGHVLEEGIDGNPDGLSEDELHAAAWPLVEAVALEQRRRDLDRYGEAEAKGRIVSGLQDVMVAALQGRIEVLFVARDEHRWGTFTPETGEVHLHDGPEPGDEELLDRAAVETYRTAGSIYLMERDELPGSKVIAALTRY
jgi:hypothetical protein